MGTMRNRAIWLLVAAVFCVLGFAALLNRRGVETRGVVNGLPPQTLDARPEILGVNVELTQYSPKELDENLGLIAAAGFTWVRQPLLWSEIEAEQGTYDWDATDRIIEAVARHDLQIVVVLWQSPEWAASSVTAAPDDLAAFAAFAEAVAERYGDSISVYQIWDEPNLAGGWGGRPADAIEYAAMLDAVYEPLHETDSDAYVLTAGLAPTIETGPDNLSDVLYLRALYENDAGDLFDGVAGKPYGFDTGPDDRRVDANLTNFSRFVLLREEMERAGDGASLLWASHFGWNALPAGWDGEPSVWGATSPEQQAEQTVEAYRRGLEEWPWSGVLFVETWQPNAALDSNRWGFALRGQDGDLSPTVEAIVEVSEVINGTLWPGVYPAQAPLIEYSADWEFGELGADVIEDGDSRIELPFNGNQLAVITRRDNYRGYLFVEANGAPSDVLPQSDAGAYLVLTSPDYTPQVETLPIAAGRIDETTIVNIRAERGWDQWAVAGFVVGNRADTRLMDALLGITGVLALGFISSAVWVGRGQFGRLVGWADAAYKRLGQVVHLGLSITAALAVWIGAALTWGGTLPALLRRLGEGGPLILTALTAGVFYFSPWLLLTIIALIALFVLIYIKPSTGVALMLLFAPYYLLPRPLFDRAFSLVEIISLLTLAAWALFVIGQRRENGWPSPLEFWYRLTTLDKAIGLFMLVAIVSISWAPLKGVALTELRQMVLEPFVVYLVLRTVQMNDQERWRIVDLLILTGVIVSIIGFYQAATGIDVITAEAGSRRFRSVFGTPNNAALFLGRLVPLAAAVALIGGQMQRRWAYGVGAVIMLGATALTLSRGGILLALPAGLSVVVIFWLGRRGVFLVIAGLILQALALIPLSRIPRFAALLDFDSETSTNLFRVQLWQSTLQMIRDHPITGVGLDQFLYEYRSYYILPEAWRQPDLSQPHNLFLNYWVRLGVVGLIAGMWIQVVFWHTTYRLQQMLREQNNSAMRALVIGLMGSMAAFLAHGMVDATHFVIDLAFIYFMTLGLLHQINEEAEIDAIEVITG